MFNDTAQCVVRGGVQNPLAYLLATLRKAQDGEFDRYRRSKVAVSEFVLPAVSESKILVEPRKKWDISKLVAETQVQCLGSGQSTSPPCRRLRCKYYGSPVEK